MTFGMIVVLGLLIWVFVALIWKVVDPIIVGVSVPVILALTGISNPSKVFSDFSNPTVLFFMSIFIIGKAIMKTGLADYIGSTVINAIGHTGKRLNTSVAVVSGGMSAFLNDTGTTGCLMPIVNAMAQKANISVSKVYMTLAFFASLGGTCTLVGTTPNIIASGILEKAGYMGLGFFEIGIVGIPITILSFIYVYFFSNKLLPERIPSEPLTEYKINYDRKGMFITLAVFLFLVLSLAFKVIPYHLAAIIGSIIIVITGCITVDEAISSFNMPTLFLVAGIFPLSAAMSSTGLAKMFVDIVSQYASGVSPFIAILIIIGLTTLLTQFMMGTSLSAIMLPIGVIYSEAMGIDARGVVMGIAVATSLAFCTPFGTGPNLLIWKPGGYEVSDYVKMGLPIVIGTWIISSLIIYFVY